MNNGVVEKRTVCQFCASNCGVRVFVQEGKIVDIKGNKDHPATKGHACERLRAAVSWLNHPDQLKYPLKRAGERGDNKWERISWDQAMDEIAEKLKTLKEMHGPETLVVNEGTVRGTQFWQSERFLYQFGNPHNVAHPGIVCGLPLFAMGQAGGGSQITPKTLQDLHIDHTECVVLWGVSLHESWPLAASKLTRRMRDKNIRLIVIDPRKIKIADKADFHIQPRPGTDGALALAWAHVIIKEKLYDEDFVKNWTVGFDALAERVKEYPPEKVSGITGLTVDEIVGSARMYATSKPGIIMGGLATDMIGLNGTRVTQTRDILQALLGNIDVLGGSLMFGLGPMRDGKRPIRDSEMELIHTLPEANKSRQLGYDRFKLMTFQGYDQTTPHYEKWYEVPAPTMHRMGVSAPLVWRAILTKKPYPVTAMINWESNPLLWGGNTKLIHEAMKSPNLELFVVNEMWMTPTALHADYVMPIASWMERPHFDTIEDLTDVYVGGEQSIEPLGERKEDYYFWRELAIRCGQEETWPWKDTEEQMKYRMKPSGIPVEELTQTGILLPELEEKKYEKKGFATPSGKVELSSSILENLGYDPLPFYEEPWESPIRTPEVYKEYPYILNTGGHFKPQFHSEQRHFGMGLREMHPDPLTDIHTDDARDLSIEDGDWIYIETKRGRIKQKARVSDNIMRGVINAQASWWFPEMPAEAPSFHGLWESNANVLTIDDPEACDPLTGGWQSRALLCKVYKAE